METEQFNSGDTQEPYTVYEPKREQAALQEFDRREIEGLNYNASEYENPSYLTRVNENLKTFFTDIGPGTRKTLIISSFLDPILMNATFVLLFFYNYSGNWENKTLTLFFRLFFSVLMIGVYGVNLIGAIAQKTMMNTKKHKTV